MSRVTYTYPDGTIYVERPGSRWGRIRVEYDQGVFSGNTVMARAVQDISPPVGRGKGSTIPFDTDWFDYLDNFHTKAASNWLRTPHMLWFNRGYVGDSRGGTLASGADKVPTLECIAFPANIIRIIGQTETHYEIFALPTDKRPTNYNPAVFNFKHYPWIFAKAQACSVNGDIQNVGTGLDIYHMNVRKPNKRHWMHKGDVELFRECPFTATDGVSNWIIVDYMFVGASIYGITDTGRRVPLLLARKPGEREFPTDWRCVEPTVISPVT